MRFLRDMLHHAYYWKERAPGEGPGPVQLYVKAWGRAGDTAVIAIEDGFPVGAAWFRLFPRERPGYGFVDASTPELAIAVVPSRRGRGIGDALLDVAARARARRTAIRRCRCASTSATTMPIRVYERHGFERVDETDDSLTMRARLA